MSSILAELGKEFERASRDKLAIEYGSTTRIKSRVEADEAADLIINERFVLEDLLHQARIANGTLVDIARSPLAFGVRAGGEKRDVSTIEALKQTLLGAESIAQPDASGGAQHGTYFVNLIRYLGIADQVKPKIRLTMGGDAAAQAVASGAAQMGVAQRRNFNTLPGVQMLEPLPDLPEPLPDRIFRQDTTSSELLERVVQFLAQLFEHKPVTINRRGVLGKAEGCATEGFPAKKSTARAG